MRPVFNQEFLAKILNGEKVTFEHKGEHFFHYDSIKIEGSGRKRLLVSYMKDGKVVGTMGPLPRPRFTKNESLNICNLQGAAKLEIVG